MDFILDDGETVLNSSIITTEPLIGKIPHTYTAEEIALMLGALGAMVASIIYSIKNVKHSSCCFGVFNCDQRTELPTRSASLVKSPQLNKHLNISETEV